MTKKRPIEKHMDAIQSGKVDKTVVIGLRKAMNNYERLRNGWSTGTTSTVVTYDEIESVTSMIADIKPRVTGELHETGKALLQNKRYRKQLENVSDIVADIDHFKLVGYDYIGTHCDKVTPVYRAYDTKGKSFPFRNIPWQSGGNGPEILSANYW